MPPNRHVAVLVDELHLPVHGVGAGQLKLMDELPVPEPDRLDLALKLVLVFACAVGALPGPMSVH